MSIEKITLFFMLLITPIVGNAEQKHSIQTQIRSAICQLSFIPSEVAGKIGTGFFITPQQVVTNFHNIEMTKDIEDITLSQPQVEQAKPVQIKQVLALDAENDLALLEISPPVDTQLTLRTSPIQTDETVFISGYPEGDFTEITNTGSIKQSEHLNTIPINHHSSAYGASGSPVFDTEGQVTGVVSIVGDNFVHTIPLRHIQNILKNINSNNHSFLEYQQEEIQKTLRRARQGHSHAQYIMGHRFLKEGHTTDGLYWLEQSARQGHVQAQYQLGIVYYSGQYFDTTVEQNKQLGIYWLEKAAKQGLFEAQFFLGPIYYKGNGITKNVQKGIYWYKQAAKQGYLPAQFILGLVYFFESAVQDITEGIKWLEQAAKQGNPDAQTAISFIYFSNPGVTQIDKATAIHWLKKAETNGNSTAQQLNNKTRLFPSSSSASTHSGR
ncbi:MAG: bifunctional trypsin-like peptidase domain-containing/SEL1-like repeat protein [Bdellovibrionales bacterium]|nr:bifunctional trypsin-like peptidase domain-containing/SEL1-like repeat protein [Bdellovibrionales bacterium]